MLLHAAWSESAPRTGFAAVDLAPLLPSDGSRVDIKLSTIGSATFWPLISVTNNQTQQVTVFAPQ